MHYSSCKSLGMSQLSRQRERGRVCVWGVGEIKAKLMPGVTTRNHLGSNEPPEQRCDLSQDLPFATELTVLSDGHMRCFLCLNLPGCLHEPCWTPYEFSLIYITLS